MSSYLIGVLTVPGAGLVVWALVIVGRLLRDWWTRYSPGFNLDDNDVYWRSRVAAAVVVARRFFMVPLPGGMVVVYRSGDPVRTRHGRREAQADASDLTSEIIRAVRKIEANSR